MNFERIIKRISEEFTRTWNHWDMDNRVACLTEDVRIESPNISNVYPENTDNIIIGKNNVRAYWELLAEKKGTFKVKQLSVVKDDLKVTTRNKVIGSEIEIIETFTMNEYGKINDLKYEYLDRTIMQSSSD